MIVMINPMFYDFADNQTLAVESRFGFLHRRRDHGGRVAALAQDRVKCGHRHILSSRQRVRLFFTPIG